MYKLNYEEMFIIRNTSMTLNEEVQTIVSNLMDATLHINNYKNLCKRF